MQIAKFLIANFFFFADTEGTCSPLRNWLFCTGITNHFMFFICPLCPNWKKSFQLCNPVFSCGECCCVSDVPDSRLNRARQRFLHCSHHLCSLWHSHNGNISRIYSCQYFRGDVLSVKIMSTLALSPFLAFSWFCTSQSEKLLGITTLCLGCSLS